MAFTIKIDGEKKDGSTVERNSPPQLFKQSQTMFHSKKKKAEPEVEVFTSTSLVNLVKIMHSYCLTLHVEEEGDKLRKNHTLFSQEEVWKYERPSEDSDEEINVVSDDEVTTEEAKEEEEGDEKRDGLKSVLLNGKSSRAPPCREKKKRVSFGPVQVVSFDEPVERGLNEKNRTSETASVPLNSTKALENPAGSALEPQPPCSEVNSDKAEVLPPKGETKAKSLSLQQYRQLRQKRKPLVEKQGNYTTKWPSVSEPPKELTPILCLQGQRQNSGGPKTTHHHPDGRTSGADQLHRSQAPGYKTHRTSAAPRPHPSEAKPPTHPRRGGLKRPRSESKILSPDSPLPDVTANPNVIAPESKKSPVKKLTLLSSDPPNPVLLPLPASQTSPPSTDPSSSESQAEFLNGDSNPHSTRHFQEIQNESSGTSLQQQPSSLGPKPEALSVSQDGTTLFQDLNNKLTELASGVSSRHPALCPPTTQIESSSEIKKPHPQNICPNLTKETKPDPKTPLSPSPVDAPIPVKETPEEPLPTLQFVCRVQSATADSGKLFKSDALKILKPHFFNLHIQFTEMTLRIRAVK